MCPQVVNTGSTLLLFGCFDVAGDTAVSAAVVGTGNFGGGTVGVAAVGGIATSSVVCVASAVCVATGGAAATDGVAVRGVASGDAAVGCIVIPSAVDTDVVGAVVIGSAGEYEYLLS